MPSSSAQRLRDSWPPARSAAENKAVTQLVRAHKENAYLSMNEISTEGRFTAPHWGNTSVYSYWATGEPNNSDDGQPENCVEISPEGQWNDIPCSKQLLVICESLSSPPALGKVAMPRAVSCQSQ